MKNKLLFIPLVSLAFAALTGCTNKVVNLTFGTYIEQNLDSLKQLDTSELLDKAYSDEVYLLATYQKKYSEDCLCWSTFKNVIVNYTNKYHEIINIFNMDDYHDLQIDLKIEQYKNSTPALYIFKGKEQITKFTYKNSRDKNIFSDTQGEAMYSRIHKVVNKPILYEVNDDSLSQKIVDEISTMALFVRSGCEDCRYSMNNVIIPYINDVKTDKEILYFDLESYYQKSKDETASEEEKSEYQNIKNKYGLSETGNKLYGYGAGFVPTIQYYIDGKLNDASVFFNDEISIDTDGSFYISNSFYSQDRLTSLKYAQNVTNNVLKGMKLNEDEVLKTETGHLYWNQEKAALYHKPLLEAFLSYYCR